MASDDKSTEQDKPTPKNLLEEIRRRAEEAELRRIEDDEKVTGATETPGAPPPPLSEEPPPVAEPAPVMSKAVREQKILVLRERLNVAISRRRLDKARSLLADLGVLVPGDPGLVEFEKRIARAEPKAPAAEVSAVPPAEAPKVERKVPRAPKKPGAVEKSVPELLEEAHEQYQQEKYEKAKKCVQTVLAQDPENEDALRLGEQIEKAEQIVELVKKEEARRKEAEAAEFGEVVATPVPAAAADDKDPWGTQTKGPPPAEPGLDLPPEEAGPVAPPKPPVMARMLEKASRVTIPWKPIVAVLVVAAAAVAGYLGVNYIKNKVSPPHASLLILPPVTAGGDSALAYTADGFAEDLMSDLGLVPELRVIGAVSAFSLRRSSSSGVTMAKNFGASHYLQWNFSRVGDWVVISSTLYDTLSGKSLMVNRQQSSLRELPAARQEFAARVLAGLKLVPDNEPAMLLRRVGAGNAPAYDAYLHGRHALAHPAEHSLSEAIGLFTAAIRADSTFPQAHSALGWATILEYESEEEPNGALLNQALSSVQRAIGLGWRVPETFRVWGMIEMFRLEFAKALERFDDATRVAPSDAESQRRLACAYVVNRNYEAAEAAAERSVSVDPGNPSSHITLGIVRQFIGQYVHVGVNEGKESRDYLNGALQSYERAVRLMPPGSAFASELYANVLASLQKHDRAMDIVNDRLARVRESYADLYRLARVQQSAGVMKEEWQSTLVRAREAVQAQLSAVPGDALAYSFLALISTRLGEFKEAQAASKQALSLGPRNVDVLYNTARMYTLQLDRTKALETLKRALERRYSLAQILDLDFYNLRSEAGFLRTVTLGR